MADQSLADIPDSFVPLVSSNVAGFSYDKNTETLSVTFTSGKSYSYYSVDPDTVREFMHSQTPGRFVHMVLSGYAYD
jgi:hypothetical protein